MATPTVVRRSLSAFANNYNKTDAWVEDTLKLWARGLAGISDRDLVRGTETWCRTKRTLPNLARLLELISADPDANKAPDLNGCPACDMTGWRELARHYTQEGRDMVRACVAPCECPKGQRLAKGDRNNEWHAIVEHWHRLPNTTKVFHSTAEHPHLTTYERNTAEQVAAMKQRAEQAKQQQGAGTWQHAVRPNK